MSDAPLMLSVSGLRGLVGRSLTPLVATKYAAAFGEWLKSSMAGGKNTGHAPHVVLGRDSRPSGQMIEAAAAAGLMAVGCRVTSLGIVTTPGVAIMTEHLGADGGMVITASHNPIEWNGIKALRHDGVAPPAEEAGDIIARFKGENVAYAPVEKLLPLTHDDSTHTVHVDRILSNIDVRVIADRKIKVVLDSVNGAGGPATAMLLRRLGAEVIHLNAEPTGRFPHAPEPTRENLVGLGKAVREHGADVGFAQDPDADRLAIVDETGAYIGEEYTLTLATLHVLQKHPRVGTVASTVATNLSTSRMIDDIAGRAGARVVRTPVGEANVAEAMKREGAVIGGEGNGGVIWPKVIHVRDSLVGIALVLEMLAERDQPLSRIVQGVPAYAIIKDKVEIKPGTTEQVSAAIRRKWASLPTDTQDGTRIDWPAPGNKWIHVRASNTEPILRIIAEAPDAKTAQALISEVRELLGSVNPRR